MNDNRTRSWCPISRLETMGAPGKDRKTADQVKIILSAIRKFSRAMTKKDSVTLGHVDFVWESLDIDRKELNSAAARRATVSLDAASVAKRGFLRVTNYRYRPANCTGGIRRVRRGPTVWPISAQTLD